MPTYPIPSQQTRTELMVANSRFIATAAPVFSVTEARQWIAQIRTEFANASHNVPAYIIGHGASLISHCSDDGEPSGTAGRPVLAVLAGSGLGDVAVVITRYFGGTKLGTGGLVRAYSESTRQVIAITRRAQKIPTHTILIAAPYSWYERLGNLTQTCGGQFVDQDFGADITLTLSIPVAVFPSFQNTLTEASNGSIQAVIINTADAIVPIMD